jgi:hypothetical protein
MKYGNKIDLVILAMVMPKMGDRKPTWNWKPLIRKWKRFCLPVTVKMEKQNQYWAVASKDLFRNLNQVDVLLSKVRSVLDSNWLPPLCSSLLFGNTLNAYPIFKNLWSAQRCSSLLKENEPRKIGIYTISHSPIPSEQHMRKE